MKLRHCKFSQNCACCSLAARANHTISTGRQGGPYSTRRSDCCCGKFGGDERGSFGDDRRHTGLDRVSVLLLDVFATWQNTNFRSRTGEGGTSCTDHLRKFCSSSLITQHLFRYGDASLCIARLWSLCKKGWWHENFAYSGSEFDNNISKLSNSSYSIVKRDKKQLWYKYDDASLCVASSGIHVR